MLTRKSRFTLRYFFFLFFVAFVYSTNATDSSFKLDFDGDGKTDIGVYREGVCSGSTRGISYFYVINSQSSQVATYQWGEGCDAAAVADYDNDGHADYAIFQSWDDIEGSTSNYWISYSSGGYAVIYYTGFGTIQSRNYFGDGRAEQAVFKGINLTEWPEPPCFIYTYFINNFQAGQSVRKDVTNDCNPNDQGVWVATGDYNNDGKSDPAAFIYLASNPTSSYFKVWYSPVTSGYSTPDTTQVLDIEFPIPGDYDGDGKTDFAGGKIVNGNFYWRIKKSSNGIVSETQFGVNGDKPVPGDYDGDGKTDIAVFRPSNSVWYILRSSDSGVTYQTFGVSTDIPLTQTNAFICCHSG